MERISGITGVVMAGGKSTRMGKDKASMPFQGGLLIESPIRAMQTLFPRVVLSVSQNHTFPEISLPKVVDRYPGIGPLGGITSVLEEGESRIFCVACDMPYLNLELIHYLCSLQNMDAVVPRWQGRAETLHALYSAALLASFQQSIREKRYRITDSLPSSNIAYPGDEEIQRFDSEGLSFRNINTPGDYEDLA